MATTQSTAVGPFQNEPLVDYKKPENAAAMRAAIAKVRQELGREYDLAIGGKRSKTTGKITSLNPAKPSEVVGIHQKAGAEQVEPAMQAALAAFETWKHAPVEQRAWCSRWPIFCAGASSSSTPGWFWKWARTTMRPRPIPARPSTSAKCTRAKRCTWERRSRRCNFRASGIISATLRWAWAR